jgi:hypothetical protein
MDVKVDFNNNIFNMDFKIDLNNNDFDMDLNGLVKKSNKDEICEFIVYMFITSPKRHLYKLFFTKNSYFEDHETLSCTGIYLSEISTIFKIILFVHQKWIDESLLTTLKNLETINDIYIYRGWLEVLEKITHKCEKVIWETTKIDIGVYYYKIISMCAAYDLLRYMDSRKVVSVETLQDECSYAIRREVDLGISDEEDCVDSIVTYIGIIMDSYCANLRKQVLRELDADFDEYE